MFRKKSEGFCVKLFTCMMVLAALLIFFPGTGSAGEIKYKKGVIKLGHVEGLTGPIAGQKDAWKGKETIAGIINGKGGIRGHKIETLWADTKFKPTLEVNAYKKFCSQGIVGMMTCNTAAHTQLKTMGNEYKVPALLSPAQELIRKPPHGWSYSVYPTYGDMAAGMMDWIVKTMWKKSTPPKVAFISTDTSYGRGPQECIPYLKSKGIETVYIAYVPMTSVDLTPQLMHADRKGADFIISNALAEGKALIRDFKRLGLNKKGKYIISPWTPAFDSIYPGAKKAGSGFLIGTWPVNIPDTEGQGGLPVMKELNEYQMKKYGSIQQASLFHALCTEMIVMCDAVGKAIDAVGYDKLDGVAVRAQLEKLQMPASQTFGLMPDLKATPGKRGMTNQCLITLATDGKWNLASDGWASMPNMLDWKNAHPNLAK